MGHMSEVTEYVDLTRGPPVVSSAQRRSQTAIVRVQQLSSWLEKSSTSSASIGHT